MSTAARALRLPSGVYVLCDDSVRPELSLERKAELLLEGGARALQLRMKRTGGRQAVESAKAVVSLAHRAGAVCVINDRVDWALLSSADGVHLGADDLPVADARRLLGPEKLVGGTSRSLADVERLTSEGADHAG